MRILIGKYINGVGATTIVPGVAARLAPITIRGPKGAAYRAEIAAMIEVVSGRTPSQLPLDLA